MRGSLSCPARHGSTDKNVLSCHLCDSHPMRSACDNENAHEQQTRSETVYLKERLQLLQDEIESNSHRHRLALDAFTAVLAQGSRGDDGGDGPPSMLKPLKDVQRDHEKLLERLKRHDCQLKELEIIRGERSKVLQSVKEIQDRFEKEKLAFGERLSMLSLEASQARERNVQIMTELERSMARVVSLEQSNAQVVEDKSALIAKNQTLKSRVQQLEARKAENVSSEALTRALQRGRFLESQLRTLSDESFVRLRDAHEENEQLQAHIRQLDKALLIYQNRHEQDQRAISDANRRSAVGPRRKKAHKSTSYKENVSRPKRSR